MEREHIQHARRMRATLIVVAACVAIAIIGAASCTHENTPTALAAPTEKGSYVESVWDDVMHGESFGNALEQAGFKRLSAENAPDWFEREFAPLATFDFVFANSSETLFELQMAGTQESALEKLCAVLADKGWLCTESDMAGVVTLNKAEGECKWAMLECSEADGECCIVMHIQRG